MRLKQLGANNERLTIKWLQQSVSELRKQLVDLQQIASNAMRDVMIRTQSLEDLATLRSDFQQLKLEMTALRERQQTDEGHIHELRETLQQQEQDFNHALLTFTESKNNAASENQEKSQSMDTTEPDLSSKSRTEQVRIINLKFLQIVFLFLS